MGLPVVRQFIAGSNAAAALEHARNLETDGIGAILNKLGEHYTRRREAIADTDAYCALLKDIGKTDFDICISVKPTQLGLEIDEALFENNFAKIVDVAVATDTFVWIDMENHTTTDITLDVFETHISRYPQLGVCLQSNLKRTRQDLERLSKLPGKVRLVKGAYNEPKSIAFTGRDRINRAYRSDLSYAFRTFDGGLAIASHDLEMIQLASALGDRYGTDYEIQMLMGIRERKQRELATTAPVYQYVPYGTQWLSYFYRRIRERKSNALLGVKALVSR